MYSKVNIGKHFSDVFPVQNGLKQEDASSPLLLNSALGYAIRKVQRHTETEWETQPFLVYADDNLLGESINVKEKHRSSIRC
jgi:hypothetical protein